MADERECFVISPIGERNSETRKVADQLLRHVITAALNNPAVKDLHYKPERADQLSALGVIGDQVIEHITNAPLVVAVLHENNPNVYYEMAVRDSLMKPVILIAPEGAKLPFDVSGIRMVFVNITDADSIVQAAEDVARHIRDLEDHPERRVSNPVTRAFAERDVKKFEETTERIRSLGDDLKSQIIQLGSLSQQIADYTRKPLKGIPAILVAIDEVLQRARSGGDISFVGMTLGIGPPHRFRHASSGRPSGSIERDLKEAGSNTTDFNEVILRLNLNLMRVVETAAHPTIVCLDRSRLRGAFLEKLATRASYAALSRNIDKVEAEIKTLHDSVEAKAANKPRPVRYLSTLPLQLLIVDKGGAEPGRPARRAALVFHVGSENLDATLLEDGELGFYTEVDQVVDMFDTMAKSLYQTASV